MSKEINFTNKGLSSIKAPSSGRDIYRDTKERSLILMVGYGQSKVYYLYKKIGSKPRRIKIGTFPDLSVSEARLQAAKVKAQIVKGSVFPDRYFSKMTFKQLFDKFISDYAVSYKKTWKQDVAIMSKYGASLYVLKISSIDQDIIQELFNKVSMNSGKVTANRFLSLLVTVFNHAIKCDMMVINPASNIKKHKEKSRDRYLTGEELPRFFSALEIETNKKIKDFVLLLLYTGARKSNVLGMKWENISFKDKTWYIPDTKNSESQLIPLIDAAMERLENRYKEDIDYDGIWVFPSLVSKSGHMEKVEHAWSRILQNAGIKDLRLHDLRRTMGSWMAKAGSSSYIIGKALNHKSQQSTAIYARLDTTPVRESMNKAVALFTTET